MISERKFSSTFLSFWKQLFPMGDTVIRRLNIACERQIDPLDSTLPVSNGKRSVINELSFRLFKEKIENNKVDKKRLTEISNEVIKYIGRLSNNISTIEPLELIELEEALDLAISLSSFFETSNLSSLQFWPTFNGCGCIHKCKGDILYGNTLVEVKAGDRNFRINDIRQVVIYLALNFSSQQYSIKNIELINPRTGLFFQSSVKTIIKECSGKMPVDIFSDIVEFVSNEVQPN